MKFGKYADLLMDRFKLDRTDSSRPLFLDKINLSYLEIGNLVNVNWKHLERDGEIVTVPNYTTGTCTITNGSRTVTFSGSALTSVMQGRYFKSANGSNWYRIVSVPTASSIVLASAIQEDSGSA